ncbi:hypothetical protein B0A50_08517 [Salinomyces thailandicus]|uniref:Myb/SANT-like domain-containing protein n=1 Tax=Salinomyces thailandicus TaxID=706561 RepID=A0A4U0TJ44_9PEZI|nr:hypothetical protein B0A50_08517 [Salinomyces thailandica]
MALHEGVALKQQLGQSKGGFRKAHRIAIAKKVWDRVSVHLDESQIKSRLSDVKKPYTGYWNHKNHVSGWDGADPPRTEASVETTYRQQYPARRKFVGPDGSKPRFYELLLQLFGDTSTGDSALELEAFVRETDGEDANATQRQSSHASASQSSSAESAAAAARNHAKAIDRFGVAKLKAAEPIGARAVARIQDIEYVRGLPISQQWSLFKGVQQADDSAILTTVQSDSLEDHAYGGNRTCTKHSPQLSTNDEDLRCLPWNMSKWSDIEAVRVGAMYFQNSAVDIKPEPELGDDITESTAPLTTQ